MKIKHRVTSVLVTLCLTVAMLVGMLVFAPVQVQAAAHDNDKLYVYEIFYPGDTIRCEKAFPLDKSNGFVLEVKVFPTYADYVAGTNGGGGLSQPGPLDVDIEIRLDGTVTTVCYIAEIDIRYPDCDTNEPGHDPVSCGAFRLYMVEGLPPPCTSFGLDVDNSTFAAEYPYTGSPCPGVGLKYKGLDRPNSPYPEADFPLQTEVIYESSDGAGYNASTPPTEPGEYKCTYTVARPVVTASNKIPVGAFTFDFLGDMDPANAPPAFFQTETTSQYYPANEQLLDLDGNPAGSVVERKNLECTYTCYFKIVSQSAPPTPTPDHTATQTPGTLGPGTNAVFVFNGEYVHFSGATVIHQDGTTYNLKLGADSGGTRDLSFDNTSAGKAESSSVKITLYAAWLDTLPAGTYTLKVDFDDGTVQSSGSADFTLTRDAASTPESTPASTPESTPASTPESTPEPGPGSPQTGDGSNAPLWVLCGGAALLGMVLLIRRRVAQR